MNRIKTVGKKLVFSGQEGRVRVAAYQFERVRVYNAGTSSVVESPVFVETALVMNLPGQAGLWLNGLDLRDLKCLLARMEADSGDVPDDMPPKQGDGQKRRAQREERVREMTRQYDKECLARNLDVLAAAARLANEAETKADDDECEEEHQERRRIIQGTLWKDFASLQCLPDKRKLPDAVKAEQPVSALALTQWSNYADLRTA